MSRMVFNLFVMIGWANGRTVVFAEKAPVSTGIRFKLQNRMVNPELIKQLMADFFPKLKGITDGLVFNNYMTGKRGFFIVS